MVRRPGFEPGSRAWQTRVLVQARRPPLVFYFIGGFCVFKFFSLLELRGVCCAYSIFLVLAVSVVVGGGLIH